MLDSPAAFGTVGVALVIAVSVAVERAADTWHGRHRRAINRWLRTLPVEEASAVRFALLANLALPKRVDEWKVCRYALACHRESTARCAQVRLQTQVQTQERISR